MPSLPSKSLAVVQEAHAALPDDEDDTAMLADNAVRAARPVHDQRPRRVVAVLIGFGVSAQLVSVK